MNFIDHDLNKYKSKDTFIDLENNRMAAKDIEIWHGELGSNARLKEDQWLVKIIFGNQEWSFTTCDQKDCPPWALKASEIKHDKSKKQFITKILGLNYWCTSILFSKFSSWSTVSRQSGFNSIILGLQCTQVLYQYHIIKWFR